MIGGAGDATINLGSGVNNLTDNSAGGYTVNPGPLPGYYSLNGQDSDHAPSAAWFAAPPNPNDWQNVSPYGYAYVDIHGGGSQTVTWELTASDLDPGDTLSFSIVDGTRGSVVPTANPGRAQWSLTVNPQDIGHSIKSTVRVTDSHGLWADQDFFAVVGDTTLSQNWSPLARRAAFGTDSGNPLSGNQWPSDLADRPGDIAVLDGPHHAAPGGWIPHMPDHPTFWQYTAEEGFAGKDTIKYKNYNSASLESNENKMDVYSDWLDVPKIEHNTPTGQSLTRAEKQGQGAYIPLNDDDDDYNGAPDAAQQGRVAGPDGRDDERERVRQAHALDRRFAVDPNTDDSLQPGGRGALRGGQCGHDRGPATPDVRRRGAFTVVSSSTTMSSTVTPSATASNDGTSRWFSTSKATS
jgi:hypothetical protein